MFVAQELKKKSIAEYLLYMWQVEDIIRAYGCSLPVIKKQYIEGRGNRLVWQSHSHDERGGKA